MTDERVRWESGVFDHPELRISAGHQGNAGTVYDDGTGKAITTMQTLPAVGYTGRSVPLAPFAEGLPPMPTSLRLAGSGVIFPENSLYRASFSVDMHGTPTSGVGLVKYYYGRTRMSFESTGISNIVVSGDLITVTGSGKVNGVSGFTFTAGYSANGPEPRTFGLTIKRPDTTTYYSVAPRPIAIGGLTLSEY